MHKLSENSLVLEFWNAMIYLHYCVSDPWWKSLHAVRRFVSEKSPGKIRKSQKDSKVVWCSLGMWRGRTAPLKLHPMWQKMHRPSAIQACAEPMVPNTCAEPMVKTTTHREVSWKGGGLACDRTGGNPLKIIRWKDLEIISWILDGNYFQVSAPKDMKYSKGQPNPGNNFQNYFKGGGRGPLDEVGVIHVTSTVIPDLASLAYLHCCDHLLFRVCFVYILFCNHCLWMASG